MEEDFVLGLTKKDKVILHEIEGHDARVAPQSDQDVRVNPKCCAPNNNHVEETLDPRCKITVPPNHK